MAARRSISTTLIGLATIVLLACAPRADAVILPAVTVDGPSENIVGFGGLAMAEDGTGGLVYLKRVDGVAHVFVSRYIEGRWLAPIEADPADQYGASWPVIGAADGGELIVAWATPYATEGELPVDQLLAATLDPGSSQFGRAIMIDPNIRDGTGTSPDLAVSTTGQADIVYRVVNNVLSLQEQTIPLLHPGDVIEQVRVAHYNGARWSKLGAINRDTGVSMRPPTAANAPKIALVSTGNGVVVWQEPEINGVARIWARRIYGSTLDYVLPVSAATYDGVPISTDADAPSVAFSLLGQAEVAYRQNVGPGSPLPGPRIFLNILPDGESTNGAEFSGATVADADVAGGDAASIGPPSIDIDEKRDMRLVYDSNGTPRVIEGTDRGLVGALTLGPPFVGAEQASASVMDPEGGDVAAWPSADAAGNPAVAVREDFPDGAVQTALVGGGAGGEVGELAVGRSGLGDALIAFRQGALGNASIVATEVSKPPAQFPLTVPKGWIKPSQVTVSWAPASTANGPLTYGVVLDGRLLATPPGAFAMKLDPHALGNGRHEVQILATDIDGQATLTPPDAITVDGTPPALQVTRTHGDTAVTVRIVDRYSGVAAGAVSVSFGDGQHARGATRFQHRYAHAGVYQIVALVRDKIGNAGVVRELVSIR